MAKVPTFIKTDCGKAKYQELSRKKGILASIRLAWFIFFAAIKDWNIPDSDQVIESEDT